MSVIRREDLDFVALEGRDAADPFGRASDIASSTRIVRLVRTEGRTAHRHPHSEEIVHVVSGTGTVWIDGNRERVGAGDTVRIPAGAAHATVPDPGVAMELVCFFPHPDLAQNSEPTDIDVTKVQDHDTTPEEK